MKRSLVAALILGALVSIIVIAAHVTHMITPADEALANFLAAGHPTTRVVSVKILYPLVVLLAIGLPILVLSSWRRGRLTLPVVVLALELLAVSWICQLYQISFSPLLPLIALLLGFLAAHGYAAIHGRSRSALARNYFRGRISDEQHARIANGQLHFAPEARGYETTAVVCDIANKHDLAEEFPPALLAEVTGKFIQHAAASFLEAGAYIETITGEGIVAIFGFPGADEDQADRATRHALKLLATFEKMRTAGSDELCRKFTVHFGISSGTTIMAPLPQDNRSQLVATGEPVELARRFCIANRFYGSNILIGPRTFEMSSKTIVARPIDFLSGVDVRERHEIYEPLMLASEATPEQIARRDAFWNGVVLYREKRWGESYSQFQNARGPDGVDDAPLQLYVRRLEPLALNLVDSSYE